MGIIYPAAFHLKLCGHHTSWQGRYTDIFVICVGMLLSIMTTYQTIAAWNSQQT
jgi:amino acid permease